MRFNEDHFNGRNINESQRPSCNTTILQETFFLIGLHLYTVHNRAEEQIWNPAIVGRSFEKRIATVRKFSAILESVNLFTESERPTVATTFSLIGHPVLIKVAIPATLIKVPRCIPKLRYVNADVVLLINRPQPPYPSSTIILISRYTEPLNNFK
jgi:hypothetical protein